MKKIYLLIITLFTITISSAQYGASISYSTENSLGLDFFYFKESNRFHIGYSQQFNGQMNEVVKERKSNYGLTKIEDGDYFWLMDFGYSRVFYEKITIHPELSFGKRNEYTNYEDNRFTDNGYSLINESKSIAGFGLNIGYFFNKNFETFVGFHSLKKVNFGIRYSLNI